MCVAAGGGADGVSGAVTVGRAARGCECVTVGLWQEPCPTRCFWRRGVCGTPSPLREKGSCRRDPRGWEEVKWTRGAGTLVNLSEAHSTFVLGYGVCVTCSDSGVFIFGYVCGCVFGFFYSTLGIFGYLSL